MLHLKKAIHTRWLPHVQAVTSIICTLLSPLTTLDKEVAEKDNAVACQLLHAIKCYKLCDHHLFSQQCVTSFLSVKFSHSVGRIDLCVVKIVANVTRAYMYIKGVG